MPLYERLLGNKNPHRLFKNKSCSYRINRPGYAVVNFCSIHSHISPVLSVLVPFLCLYLFSFDLCAMILSLGVEGLWGLLEDSCIASSFLKEICVVLNFKVMVLFF